MAIAQDASTPAFSATLGGTNLSTLKTATYTQTSASFSPPAGSLVVVLAAASEYSYSDSWTDNSGLTCKDSLNNSYTRKLDKPEYDGLNASYAGLAVFERYYASAPGGITVGVTVDSSHINSSGVAVNIYPFVLTGCDSAQAGPGAASKNYGIVPADSEVSVTTTAAGSWVFLVGVAIGSTPDALTSYINGVTLDGVNNNVRFGKQANPTGTPGPTTLGYTDTAAFGAQSGLEILPSTAEAKTVNAGQAAADGAAPGPSGPILYAAPAWAGAASDLAGGSGSWASASSADGAPDGTWATWTAP